MGKFKIGDKVRFESMLGDIEGEVIELNAKQTVMDRSERGIVFKITRHPKQPSNIGKEMFVDNKSYWRLFTISENKMKKSELRQLIKEEIRAVLKEQTMSIADQLQDLENEVKNNLHINSSDPVYKDATIRKKWMDQIVMGVKKIGVSNIISKWNNISRTLENDNYHQLSLFLELALKMKKSTVDYYTNKSQDDKNSDRDFYKDSLAYKIN